MQIGVISIKKYWVLCSSKAFFVRVLFLSLFCPPSLNIHSHSHMHWQLLMCEKRKSAKTNHRQRVHIPYIQSHVHVLYSGMHIKLKFFRLNSRSIKNKRNNFNFSAHKSSYTSSTELSTISIYIHFC